MALDTYSGLKAATGDWLARTDLTAVIPDLITLAEAQINRVLRTTRQLTRTTLSLSGVTALPADFAGISSLVLQTNPVQMLNYVGLDELGVLDGGYAPTGRPTAFTITQGGIEVTPAPDGAYTAELIYHAKIPALSDSNPTNWLLTEAPDVYLYGALTQGAPYLGDDARIGTWATLFTQGLTDLTAQESRIAVGPRPAMRIRRFG